MVTGLPACAGNDGGVCGKSELFAEFFVLADQAARRDAHLLLRIGHGVADAGGGANGETHGGDTFAVAGDAGHVAATCPAAVSVHDDGDVLWEPVGIKLMKKFCLLAIQSGRSCCLQRDPLLNSRR